MFSSFAVFFLAQSRIALYREFFPLKIFPLSEKCLRKLALFTTGEKSDENLKFNREKMGNCFKCFEKQEDEDQLINDEDGECFFRRK